jgi:hypothetical protein
MISIKAEVIGTDSVMAALEKLRGTITEKMVKFMAGEGAEMEAEIKGSMRIGGKIMAMNRAGRKIKVTGPRGGRYRQHSSPGEPPYVQTGALRASIGSRVTVGKEGHTALDIGAIRGKGSELRYARALELGTATMRPRPYLMPVVMRHISKWPAGIRITIQDVKVIK